MIYSFTLKIECLLTKHERDKIEVNSNLMSSLDILNNLYVWPNASLSLNNDVYKVNIVVNDLSEYQIGIGGTVKIVINMTHTYAFYDAYIHKVHHLHRMIMSEHAVVMFHCVFKLPIVRVFAINLEPSCHFQPHSPLLVAQLGIEPPTS